MTRPLHRIHHIEDAQIVGADAVRSVSTPTNTPTLRDALARVHDTCGSSRRRKE